MTDNAVSTFGNLALKREPSNCTLRVVDGHGGLIRSREHALSAPDVVAYRPSAPLVSEKTPLMVFLASVSVALCLAITMALGSVAPADPLGDYHSTLSVTVQPGDSLWSIASEVTSDATEVKALVSSIRELNGLSSATLHPGMRLTVPAR